MAWLSLRTWVTGEFHLAPGQLGALERLNRALIAEGAQIATLTGPAGVGKSSLAGLFAQRNQTYFRGGATAVGADQDFRHEALRNLSRKGPALLVVEEAQRASAEVLESKIDEARADFPNLQVLVLSQRDVAISEDAAVHIPLAGFTAADVASALELQVDDHSLHRFHEWLNGRAPTIRELGEAIKRGILGPEQLGQLDTFEAAALLGPDGLPAGTQGAETLGRHVSAVTSRIYDFVASDPELLRALSPREFEEVVAEHFRRRGYDVELTAQSRDGGKDIYAACHNEFGSLLYVVECKAYDPSNLVGVGLVRQLYGVAQHARATAGILATTSYFTRPALAFQKDVQYQLSLKDFRQLARWLKPD
jgi:restriction system protein